MAEWRRATAVAGVVIALSLDLGLYQPSAAQQPPQPPGSTIQLRSTIPDVPTPKAPPQAPPKAAPAAGLGLAPQGQAQISLIAHLTEEGQRIESGLVWRVFQDKGTRDGKPKLITESRAPTPTLKLPAGDYLVNAAFGRAQMTRRLSLKPGDLPPERFVLNAGGLRLTALVANGEPAAPGTVSFDIFSDERDQFGNRTKIASGAKAGLIVRLNSGIYNVVSTYGDANAILRTDVSVEAGKLTEATVAHAVGKATFKLVLRAGGEAQAETQWTIANAQGEVVKESVGALPTHMLAPGTYVVNARSQGRQFRRDFTIQHNDALEVEVLVEQ
jgi:hypothetical protein